MERDSPASFSLFSRLPVELRLRIWNYSLPGTRIVPVRCGGDELAPDSAPRLIAATGCTTTTPNPANLSICAESRVEATKSYRRCFGFARQPGRVYFDPRRDVLYFGPRQGYMATDAQFRTCMTLCDRAELAAVRRIAVSDALFWIDDTYRSMTAASLTMDVLRIIRQALPNLVELVFVPREQDEACRDRDHLDHILQRMHQQVVTAINTLTEQEEVTWTMPRAFRDTQNIRIRTAPQKVKPCTVSWRLESSEKTVREETANIVSTPVSQPRVKNYPRYYQQRQRGIGRMK
ncbi:hypothetical protein CCM_07561 [Cordyceps militaris CM01]|uniref:2EXR domain-containing protein n=1 Tax=Cordyceps militaris (strain CM01) TaxID=983644 RepID=G3JQ59_CORMM|nr:uncharacterized protein CCM_07561 [Cordyceps militaris CM01]EGX89310.1 hypothetical protein CCM_07561 [Cordyceps militaris CM01]